MTPPPECPKCGASLNRWYAVDRAAPHDVDRAICFGFADPGPNWWAVVQKWWDVSDRPNPRCWVPPRCAAPTPGGCALCAPRTARPAGPGLFDGIDGDGGDTVRVQ